MSKDRFEAFTDGVFAFAITLLVLGIALPVFKTPPSDLDIRTALVALWPNVIAYALSFSVIGIMWQNHHAIFRLVERIDRNTVALNLMLLAGTVFIPFATSTLGAYPTMHSSTFLYGAVLTYTSIAFNGLLLYLIRKHAFATSIPDAVLAQTLKAYRVGLATYALAALLALWLPLASFAAYVLIAVYYVIPRGVDDDL